MNTAAQDNSNNGKNEESIPTASFNGMALGPRSQIAQFRIEQEIGRGAMGVVYLAHDLKLDRKVAIKSLPPDMIENKKARMRFKKEALALASINHPNIATIYDVLEQDPQRHYLILEYIPGKTLTEYIGKKPLKLKKALEIASQTATALAAAHEQGVIHRDLKPGNIKITPDGKVKVLDFGLAKATEGQDLDKLSTLTLPGRIIGTPAYMSPEQARGKDIDKRTDIWSFGCCLFEMLTASLPFHGETLTDIIDAVLNVEPNLSLLPLETPPQVTTLLRRCMEKEPQRRLRDIGDIAITLEETINIDPKKFAISTSTSPRKTSTLTIREKWISRFWPVGAGLLLGLIVVGIGFLHPRTRKIAPDQIRSLAVLPFEASGADPNLNQFAMWIPDDISVDLQKLKIFDRVPAWSLARTFTEASPKQAAHELDVQGLVQGRIRIEGTEMSINLELVDGQSSARLWADTFRTTDGDIEGLKRRIVLSLLSDGLKRPIKANEQDRLGAPRKINREAYAAYRRGMEDYFSLGEKGSRADAIAEFETARRLDPDFVDPLVMLADMEWSVTFGKSSIRPREGFAKAKKRFEEAFRLAPENGTVLWEQGTLAMFGEWDWKKTKESFRKAVASDPEAADCYEGLTWYMNRIEGRYSDAIAYVTQGLQLDPDNPPLLNAEPWVYENHGHYEKALALHERYRKDKPTEWSHLRGIARCLAEMDRLAEARENAELAVRLSEDDPTMCILLASILARSGDPTGARPILHNMEELAETLYVPEIHMAEAYAYLGEWDTAFAWLERGYAEGAGEQFTDLRRYQLLTLMGDQPRYWDLVDRMKFPALPIEHPFHEKEQQMRFGKKKTVTVQSTASKPFAPATCTEIRLPESASLALGIEGPIGGFASSVLTLSPDGRHLVYVGKSEKGMQLFHRDLTRFAEPRPLPDTEGASYAFFSADSTELGFVTDNRVRKVALNSGAVIDLCRAHVAIRGDWIGDVIYFVDHEGGRLNRVSAGGGNPMELFNVTERCRRGGVISCVLPDGRAALVSVGASTSKSSEYSEIRVVPLQGTDTKTLPIKGFCARYLSSGHLVFGRGSGVWAAPFDIERLELTGKAAPVLEGVAVESIFGSLHAAFADNGTVAFIPGHDLARGRLAWMNRQGNEEVLDVPERVYGVFDVSPDDRQFAIEVTDVKDYVWIWDAEGGGRSIADEGCLMYPVWSPDGRSLAMAHLSHDSDTTTVIINDIDRGIAREIPVHESFIVTDSWPYQEGIGITQWDAVTQVGVLNPTSSKESLRLLSRDVSSGPMIAWGAALSPSPDAAWIAYASNEGEGLYQVWIEQIDGNTRRQVSTDGGLEPVWCRDGDELFYKQNDQILASHITLEPTLKIGPSKVVFEVSNCVETKGISYRVSSDGERLYFIRRSKRPATDRINIVYNWFSELARLAPVDK